MWIGGLRLGSAAWEETGVMRFRDEIRVNERVREKGTVSERERERHGLREREG